MNVRIQNIQFIYQHTLQLLKKWQAFILCTDKSELYPAHSFQTLSKPLQTLGEFQILDTQVVQTLVTLLQTLGEFQILDTLVVQTLVTLLQTLGESPPPPVGHDNTLDLLKRKKIFRPIFFSIVYSLLFQQFQLILLPVFKEITKTI